MPRFCSRQRASPTFAFAKALPPSVAKSGAKLPPAGVQSSRACAALNTLLVVHTRVVRQHRSLLSSHLFCALCYVYCTVVRTQTAIYQLSMGVRQGVIRSPAPAANQFAKLHALVRCGWFLFARMTTGASDSCTLFGELRQCRIAKWVQVWLLECFLSSHRQTPPLVSFI